jgi:hypothetical protein
MMIITLSRKTVLAAFALSLIILGATWCRSSSAQSAEQPKDFENYFKLEQSLKERDAIISDLLRRVDTLEKELTRLNSQPSEGASIEALKGDNSTPYAGVNGEITETRAGMDANVSPASMGVVAPIPKNTKEEISDNSQINGSQDAASTAQTQTAPGTVEVSEEDELERALERTLVSEGALLLPFGKMEVSPSFRYTRTEDAVPTTVNVGGNTFIAENNRERDEFEFDLGVRFGLPFDSQLELGLPYNIVDQENNIRVLGTPVDTRSDTGTGIGDFRIGLAKTIVREASWYPDVVGRVTWDTNTGEKRDNGVGLGGSGFNELRGSFSFTKRQDPLAFVASTFYETTFEEDDVEPGDEFGFTVGTIIAASPETSLRFLFQQSFQDDIEINGNKIDGTDQTSGALTIGASSVIGRGTLIDLGVGIGVTDDAPDYSVILSVPIRFDTPFLN